MLICLYLIYCIEIWGNTNDTYLNPIITIEKKDIREISFAHYLDSTTPLFERLNILNFKRLVTQRIALLMFKYNMGILPHPITYIFALNKERHNYNTRQINTGRSEIVYKLLSFVEYMFLLCTLPIRDYV